MATEKTKNISTETLKSELQSTLLQRAPMVSEALLSDIQRQLSPLPERLSNAQFSAFSKKTIKQTTDLLKQVALSDKTEVYPTLSASQVHAHLAAKIVADLEAAFERVRLRASLKSDEKLEMLRGMLSTRYLDARLKKFFMGSEIKLPGGAIFQGKGFRSMGQEAIYAAAIRMKRNGSHGVANPVDEGEYNGDYVAGMIRDLGLTLAMGVDPYDVMAAQMGKMGHPTNGKDLHFGDMTCGVLPPAAPIALSVGNAIGMGLALKGSGRVVINCNGEGGTSSGEWHEAINFAAVKKLPVIFVVQNNQTALSTPVSEQYSSFNMAEKGDGYGLRAIAVDGTDPESVFAAVTEAANACRKGNGPMLVELFAMRMCGHAHHDDMLYFGEEPSQFIEYPEKFSAGYVDAEKYKYWRQKDPVKTYRDKLLRDAVITAAQYRKIQTDVEAEIEAAAQKVIDAKWPEAVAGHDPVFEGGLRMSHVELLNQRETFPAIVAWKSEEPTGFQAVKEGKTFWQAIAEALSEEMRRDQNVFILGEDVGGKYGNAFVILKSLLDEFGDRLMNTPLAEAAIIGAATGAAMLGKRPVAEIQFNDFVASGFNQLVNNTAKLYFRWNQIAPLCIRLPWGGLRHAGPYHSQNTEPWFYRTPGLKIVCPSTPREAKGLLKTAIRDNNPVLFYEHIALYRDPKIKQILPDESEDFTLPLGKAHLKRAGNDLTIITYGAYVHRCLQAAQILADQGFSARVLDLRSLQPLDKEAVLWCVKETNRALIVHEDSKTGGVGQSVASIIAEEAFEYLDAPVRVLGALDTPVPYSPLLEVDFLISVDQIAAAAKLLLRY